METYSLLREMADSWGLLVLFAFFVAMVVWVFRPGSGDTHSDVANIPLRHEDSPVAPRSGDPAAANQKEART